MPEYLDSTEVAKLLGVGRDTVHRYVREKKLLAYRLPGGVMRFRPEDVEAFLVPTITPEETAS